jgi:hypothetical protein
MVTHIHVCQQLDKPFRIWKSELYFTIAQALLWKKFYNWPTKLYCDNNTIEIFKSLDVLDIWDHVDTSLLSETTQINKTRFWSSGKLSVMNVQTENYMMSDLDFVCFTDLFNYNLFNGYDLGFYHKEMWFKNKAYDNPRQKLKEVNFKPNENLSWWANPFNMGTFFMGDMKLNKRYTEMALEYMKRASKLESPKFKNDHYTIFAEQYLLAAFVRANNYSMTPMIKAKYQTGGKWHKSYEGFWNLDENQDYAMHIWLDKYNFKRDPSKEDWYIFFILNKLEEIAPEIKTYISNKINDESLDKIKQSLVSK